MDSETSNYFNFITVGYKQLFKEVKKTFEKETKVQSCAVSISYFVLNGTAWQPFICEITPEEFKSYAVFTDTDLREIALADLNALPAARRALPEFQFGLATLSKPDSPAALTNMLMKIRARMREKDSLSLSYLKLSVESKVCSILNRDDIVAIAKMRITLDYAPTEGGKTSSMMREVNYSQKCFNCHRWRTTAHKLMKCTKCAKFDYCNKECQEFDWSIHEPECLNLK